MLVWAQRMCAFVCKGTWLKPFPVGLSRLVQAGGGDFAAGLFRRGIFRISNSCEISHVIFRPLCKINPLRNLAKCLVQQLPEHKPVVPFHKSCNREMLPSESVMGDLVIARFSSLYARYTCELCLQLATFFAGMENNRQQSRP